MHLDLRDVDDAGSAGGQVLKIQYQLRWDEDLLRQVPRASSQEFPVVETDGVSSLGKRSIEQRDELIASLSRLRTGVDAIASSLRNGDIRVRVLEESDGDTSQDRRREVPR